MSANAEILTNSAGQTLLDLAVKVRNSSASGRGRKETLLPQIAQLALEGHCGETIARKVGMPSRTVRHWLQELREEWIAESAAGAAGASLAGSERSDAKLLVESSKKCNNVLKREHLYRDGESNGDRIHSRGAGQTIGIDPPAGTGGGGRHH